MISYKNEKNISDIEYSEHEFENILTKMKTTR